MSSRSQIQGGAASPSKSRQTQPSARRGNRIPAATPDRDGRPVLLYASVLPAADLLSGISNNRSYIVLVMTAVRAPSGVKNTNVTWHGPWRKERAARRFVAQLSAQRPTPPSETIATQAGPES